MQVAECDRISAGGRFAAAGNRGIERIGGLGDRTCGDPLLSGSECISNAVLTSLNRLPAAGLSGPATAPSPFCADFNRPLLPRREIRHGQASRASGSAACVNAA